MKLTNSELSTVFLPALRELSTIRTNTRVAYNTAKTIKSALSAIEVFDAARKAILDAAAEQENGKPKIDTAKSEYVFSNDEDKAACVKSLNELAAMDTTFDIYPVKLAEFGTVEISAAVILSLREFIEEN